MAAAAPAAAAAAVLADGLSRGGLGCVGVSWPTARRAAEDGAPRPRQAAVGVRVRLKQKLG